MTTPNTDRIEKKILLRAPRAKVWRALTDTREFSEWFRVALDGKFEVGATVRGHITSPGWEHVKVEIAVAKLEPEKLFAYRWHPYAVDPKVDYSTETPTLVEFSLEETTDGTMLTVVESGFDRIPEHRRAEAFRMNDGGWASQLGNIERHVGA
ncbi:MAG TPA: SRPBCC family protein [Polyangiaceae bacterium]|jgi:uncharacterized protein YndB with AHSA1/START domain|nr:SRPBCC family protein [Polyangiaceae bacterium]